MSEEAALERLIEAARDLLADFIVVGRPIINAPDPVAVVHKINAALRARQADQPS